MAASAISSLIQILRPLIQNEVGLLCGVDKEMKKLSSILSTILAVLDDAELKQLQQRAIQDWLRKLKDAAYEIRDILDDCDTEASRWEYEDQIYGFLRKVWSCYPVKILLFRHNIGNRMKDVIEDLDSISQERIKLHLNERIDINLIEFYERRETGSALAHLEVFGREADRDEIVKVLTVNICGIQEVTVYTIIGMGGLGKTTLSQMVFNDGRIKRHFEPIIWVYVSPDFNVKRVMKLIIESSSQNMFEVSSLDFLQRKVREMLCGKRYLLVLDDVWNEDREEWDKLKSALSSGWHGACILVTTRSEKVSSIIRTLPPYHLPVLSEYYCWLLFQQRAFGPDKEERPDLVAIGKEIVKRCGGVPLAAKALGGLMRSKMEVKEWLNIKESGMWDLPPREAPILPALRLSYYNLPLELRHCFSYCAVFPKGSRMKKDKVIQMWMAHGFISSRGRLEVEDVGNEVWNELYKRSLFLGAEKNSDDMFMHDLVHDLARSIIEDEYYTMEAQSSSIISKEKFRHASLVYNGTCDGVFPEALRKQKTLHSIHFQYADPSLESVIDPFIDHCSAPEFACDFRNFGSLRVFDATGANMIQLSKTIGNSNYLRYLNLSKTPITELPASICNLHHLQTLNLNDCGELRRLPNKMHRLTGLRHLCLLECHQIKDTPPKLGKLTQLKTLSLFVVGTSGGQRLGELKQLDLGGELKLKHLDRVRNSMEAKEANLAGKHNLCILCLVWEYRNETDLQENIGGKEVIEALEPHPNIKELEIFRYRGKVLPVWMSNPSVLKNVVSITIDGCRNCLGLPALWHLPCLKRLLVGGMDRMEYMFHNGNNFNGDSEISATSFSSLEEMEIYSIRNLKGLTMEEEQGIVLLFPRLREMKVSFCPQVALPMLPALEKLEIWHRSSSVYFTSFNLQTYHSHFSIPWHQ